MIIKRRPYEINWSGNPIVYGFFDEEAAANNDLLFEIRIFFKNEETGAPFTMLTSLPISPVVGYQEVDIADILQTALTWTVPSLNGITESATQTGVFYIDYRRISLSGNLNEGFNLSENQFTRRVIKGGINPFKWKGNQFWQNYFAATNRFLSWQPQNRLVGLTERIFLLWYNNTNIPNGAISYKVEVIYTDGTGQSWYTQLPTMPNRLYYIPAGAAQLAIPYNVGLQIWYWTITVENLADINNPVPISEQFTFELDNRMDYNRVVLLYRNSLGGIDSIRLRGAIETSISLEGVEAETAAGADWAFAKQLPTFDRSLPHREITSYKANTGHLSKDQQDRLRDMFLIREVYTEVDGRLWPVKLLSKQFNLRSSGDKLFSLPIEFCIANGGSFYYTPEIDLGSGMSLNNVCDGRVEIIQITKTVINPNTTQVTWSLNIITSADPIAKIQWRTPGYFDQWQDYTYPNSQPLKTTHPVPGSYLVQFRTICTGGSAGAITSYNLDLTTSTGGPSIGLSVNCTIYNTTSVETAAYPSNGIWLVGAQPFILVPANGYKSYLSQKGTMNYTLKLSSLLPAQVKLTQNGAVAYGIIEADAMGALITFSNLTITGNFNIELF